MFIYINLKVCQLESIHDGADFQIICCLSVFCSVTLAVSNSQSEVSSTESFKHTYVVIHINKKTHLIDQ